MTDQTLLRKLKAPPIQSYRSKNQSSEGKKAVFSLIAQRRAASSWKLSASEQKVWHSREKLNSQWTAGKVA